jgi:tetratricopeptide (TPR) repeat protein
MAPSSNAEDTGGTGATAAVTSEMPTGTATDGQENDHDHDHGHDHLFKVSSHMSKEMLLTIAERVAEETKIVLAPFGVPPDLLEQFTTENQFVELCAGKFHDAVDIISRAVYEELGVSETIMALTVHMWTDEKRDQACVDAMDLVGNALRSLYRLHKAIELPLDLDEEVMLEMATATLEALSSTEAETAAAAPAAATTTTTTAAKAPADDNDDADDDGNRREGSGVHPKGETSPSTPTSSRAWTANMHIETVLALGFSLPKAASTLESTAQRRQVLKKTHGALSRSVLALKQRAAAATASVATMANTEDTADLKGGRWTQLELQGMAEAMLTDPAYQNSNAARQFRTIVPQIYDTCPLLTALPRQPKKKTKPSRVVQSEDVRNDVTDDGDAIRTTARNDAAVDGGVKDDDDDDVNDDGDVGDNHDDGTAAARNDDDGGGGEIGVKSSNDDGGVANGGADGGDGGGDAGVKDGNDDDGAVNGGDGGGGDDDGIAQNGDDVAEEDDVATAEEADALARGKAALRSFSDGERFLSYGSLPRAETLFTTCLRTLPLGHRLFPKTLAFRAQTRFLQVEGKQGQAENMQRRLKTLKDQIDYWEKTNPPANEPAAENGNCGDGVPAWVGQQKTTYEALLASHHNLDAEIAGLIQASLRDCEAALGIDKECGPAYFWRAKNNEETARVQERERARVAAAAVTKATEEKKNVDTTAVEEKTSVETTAVEEKMSVDTTAVEEKTAVETTAVEKKTVQETTAVEKKTVAETTAVEGETAVEATTLEAHRSVLSDFVAAFLLGDSCAPEIAQCIHLSSADVGRLLAKEIWDQRQADKNNTDGETMAPTAPSGETDTTTDHAASWMAESYLRSFRSEHPDSLRQHIKWFHETGCCRKDDALSEEGGGGGGGGVAGQIYALLTASVEQKQAKTFREARSSLSSANALLTELWRERILTDKQRHFAAHVLHQLASVEYLMADSATAVVLLNEALAKAPTCPHVHAKLGALLGEIQEMEEAERVFKAGIDLHKESPKNGERNSSGESASDCYFQYAQLLLSRQRYREAVALCRQGLELHDSMPFGTSAVHAISKHPL